MNYLRISLRFVVKNANRKFSQVCNLTPVQRKLKNVESRIRLAAAYRGLDMYGLNEGICNHLSAISPSAEKDENLMLIIPYGIHWSQVTPSLLIGVNKNNEVIEGDGLPEITALCIHRGVYAERPDVKCIMHTHMPYATTLTCLQKPELLMLHQNSAQFWKKIAYDTAYGGLGDNFQEGRRLGRALNDKSVLFMGNHGVMTVSDSIAVAFDDMYYLERASMIQVLAYSTQQPLKEMDLEVIELTSKQLQEGSEKYAESHLQSILRILSEKCSEFSLPSSN